MKIQNQKSRNNGLSSICKTAFLFLLLMLILPVYSSETSGGPSVTEGSAKALLAKGSVAPRFLLLNTRGSRLGYRDYISPKDPGDKFVILNFWSLSCIPCRQEMPALQSYVNEHSDSFQLLFVNLDKKDQKQKVQKFENQFGVAYPILLDFYQVMARNYGVCENNSCAVPSLFVVAPDGKIVLSKSGYEGKEKLYAELNALIQETQPSNQQPRPQAP